MGTFSTEFRKQVATAGLTHLDDIAARADLIQESIHGEQVALIEPSHKVSYICHQCGGKPKDSTKGKSLLLFSGLCAYHATCPLALGVLKSHEWILKHRKIRSHKWILKHRKMGRTTTCSRTGGWPSQKLCATFLGPFL